jgi:hypothetical protein
MKRASLVVGLVLSSVGAAAYADIPAGYKGTPFDPAVAGGTFNGMATTAITTAGPYPIPGRLEFENYDMGGLNVGYFTTDHIGCAGGAYRKDGQTASLCATSPMADTTYGAPNGDVFYDTGTALDGTTYPNATTDDVYIGAVRPGDWVNITVNVTTAGTYAVSSTWASGNGNPGKEGGDGAMELKISTNGTMVLDWKATFPNFNTTANFHNWKTYDMGTVTLPAGLQVIKMLSVDPHLNLDYVQFSVPGADGGVGTDAATTTDAGAAGAAGGSAGAGAAGANGTAGARGGAAGETGGSAGAGAGTAGATETGSAGAGSAGASGAAGASGSAGAPGGAGTPVRRSSSGGCSFAIDEGRSSTRGALGVGVSIVLAGLLARRRRRR